MLLRLVAAWIVGLGLCTSTSAASWFVATDGDDNNAGTLQAPFATLGKAGWRAAPGDTIYVRGGIYTQRHSITLNGTAEQPILIRPYADEKVIFDGSGTPADTTLIYIGGQHAHFEGFEVRNATRSGISTWGGKHLTIANNVVHHTWRGGIWMGHDVDGETRDIRLIGNTVYRTCLSNDPQIGNEGWPAALVVYRVTGAVIEGNTVYENHGEGIGVQESRDVLVRQNTVYDNFSVNLYFDNARYSRAEANLVYTTGNTAFYRDGTRAANGIALANETGVSDPTALHGNTVVNNILVNNHRGIYYGDYLAGGGMHDTLIAHNTVYNATRAALEIESAAHSNVRIANNLLVQAGGAALAHVAGAGLSIEGNCYWGEDSSGVFASGNLRAEPYFAAAGGYAATDYRIAAESGCAQAASVLAEVNQDYWQAPRTAAASAGAHEQDGPAPTRYARVATIELKRVIRGRKPYIEPRVTLIDEAGRPLSGATVTATWSGALSKTVHGLTYSDANGAVLFPQEAAITGKTMTFTVQAVRRAGFVYDPAQNLVTSRSITP